MDTYSIIIAIIVLTAISAFFSSSETSMMALNKYKLKHLAKQNNKKAKRSLSLVSKPETLLVTILIGNTFANILASALFGQYAESHFGKFGLMISTLVLTIVVLIFGEIIPKSFAAIYPQKLAFPFSLPLKIIMFLLYPLVLLLNVISKSILFIFGIKMNEGADESLDKDEIHTVVHESNAKLGSKNKNMLLGVLELDSILVRDVMIHHNKIEYIDISQPMDKIIARICKSESTNLLLCEEGVDNVLGVVKTKDILSMLVAKQNISVLRLRKIAKEPYFIPETVSLQTQLVNFQRKGTRFAIVVNEYGDVAGVVTVEDIMEEIVGEFSDRFDANNNIRKIDDKTYIVGGSATLREITRHTDILLESEDAKTLSGFIIEEIENLPSGKCCIKYNNILLEILHINDNKIKSIKMKILENQNVFES